MRWWAEWIGERWREAAVLGRIEVVAVLTACGVGLAIVVLALVLLGRLLFGS